MLVGYARRAMTTAESVDDPTPVRGTPVLAEAAPVRPEPTPDGTEPTPGRHRDPAGGVPAATSTVEQRFRLDRRRVHSLVVAIFAGTVIMGFGVSGLLRPDHQGWLGIVVGLAVVAVGSLVLVLDPPRRGVTPRRHLDRRRARRH